MVLIEWFVVSLSIAWCLVWWIRLFEYLTPASGIYDDKVVSVWKYYKLWFMFGDIVVFFFIGKSSPPTVSCAQEYHWFVHKHAIDFFCPWIENVVWVINRHHPASSFTSTFLRDRLRQVPVCHRYINALSLPTPPPARCPWTTTAYRSIDFRWPTTTHKRCSREPMADWTRDDVSLIYVFLTRDIGTVCIRTSPCAPPPRDYQRSRAW